MLTLPTTGDDADEPDGSVTVTVKDGDGYTVGSSASGSVTVQDDDAPVPEITVTADAASVTEGGDAVFTIAASPAPAADLPVTVTVASDGDWGVDRRDAGPSTIPTAGSATLTLATGDDSTDEPDGSVTVTVKDGSGYTPGFRRIGEHHHQGRRRAACQARGDAGGRHVAGDRGRRRGLHARGEPRPCGGTWPSA